MLQKFRDTYNEFPPNFWVLMVASFIDRLGGALLFPFFALYITSRFNVGMVEVGFIFTIFAVTSVLGSFLGGAMTDRFGRRSLLIYGLVISATSSLVMAFVNEMSVFYGVVVVVGLLANLGGPAQQAMIADILPEKKRTEGFGIWRVVANLAVTFGPAIGGFIAARSYLGLFITDAVTSIIMAVIVFRLLPETKPETPEGEDEDSLAQTIRGYNQVLRDAVYMSFIFVTILVVIVYVQMNSTMPVYLRDVQGIGPVGYGNILSLNAAMVVFFQFWITRRLSGHAPMRIMALGAFLYAVGFGLYGFNSTVWFYAFAMVIITIGEMVIVPVSQALAVRFAPDHMRGRYLAIFGFSYSIPFAIGPLLAGYIMDAYDPHWVWWGGFILGIVGALGYLALQQRAGDQLGLMDEGGETTPVTAAVEA